MFLTVPYFQFPKYHGDYCNLWVVRFHEKFKNDGVFKLWNTTLWCFVEYFSNLLTIDKTERLSTEKLSICTTKSCRFVWLLQRVLWTSECISGCMGESSAFAMVWFYTISLGLHLAFVSLQLPRRNHLSSHQPSRHHNEPRKSIWHFERVSSPPRFDLPLFPPHSPWNCFHISFSLNATIDRAITKTQLAGERNSISLWGPTSQWHHSASCVGLWGGATAQVGGTWLLGWRWQWLGWRTLCCLWSFVSPKFWLMIVNVFPTLPGDSQLSKEGGGGFHNDLTAL